MEFSFNINKKEPDFKAEQMTCLMDFNIQNRLAENL